MYAISVLTFVLLFHTLFFVFFCLFCLFLGVTVVRSCPSATWPKKLSNDFWVKKTNLVYEGLSGKSGKWTGLKNVKNDWKVEFNTTTKIELNSILEKDNVKVAVDSNTGSNENENENIKTDNIDSDKTDKIENGKIENGKIENGKIVFTLSCSDQGQVGVFPEQQENWKWISKTVKKSIENKLKIQLKEEVLLKLLNKDSDEDKILSDDYIEKSYYSEAKINSYKTAPKKKNLKEKNSVKTEVVNNEEIIRILNGFAYTGGSSLAGLSLPNIPLPGTYRCSFY